MKNRQSLRWFIIMVFFVIFIVYGWELISVYWSHSFVRLPMDILMVLAGLIGMFAYFPRKEKSKTSGKE